HVQERLWRAHRGGRRSLRGARPTWPVRGYTQAHVDLLYKLHEHGLVDVFLLDLGIVGFTDGGT
ncbi:MAG: hypothetical protein CL878_13990, partial [Dehalococcoidia bacterium]|nr:hypothetical protein [Dehalococcoidia bacterium]